MTADATRSRSNRILVILCAAAFMAMLDVFVVNVALVEIGESYDGAPLSDLSWILNGYTIIYAALLIPAGRLADKYGRKAGFIVGLVIFTAASLACAVSPTLWTLVIFRIVQAAGAAALTPTSLGLLLTALPPERRATGVKVWATTTSLAAAVGPVLGGALIKLGWPWIFLINVPVGVIALIGAIMLVPESKAGAKTRIPDLLGAVLLAIALGALSLAAGTGSAPSSVSRPARCGRPSRPPLPRGLCLDHRISASPISSVGGAVARWRPPCRGRDARSNPHHGVQVGTWSPDTQCWTDTVAT